MLAFAHPGKMGDALYTLPTIRHICNQKNVQADFWTSSYCEPMRDLFEYQPFIHKFYVSPDYVVNNWGCGGQPPDVPLPTTRYETSYQLGFRRIPDCSLHHFIGKSIGLDPSVLKISYDYPFSLEYHLQTRYIIVAARGQTTYKDTFLRFIELANSYDISIVQVGGRTDFIGEVSPYNCDYTGHSFLNTCQLMGRSMGFVGLMSAMLVLANGFSIPRLAVHDNKSWDMRHVVYSEFNHYPINPKPETLLNLIIKGSRS